MRTFSVMAYQPPKTWHWITLMGPDAQDFLHRLTTCDTRNLTIGQGTLGCLLTAQGKMRAYFRLWNLNPGEFAFEFDGGALDEWKTSLLQMIDQYTFAERMTLESQTNLACRWILATRETEKSVLEKLGCGDLQPGNTISLNSQGSEIRVCHEGMQDYGRPWISIWGRPELLNDWLKTKLPDAEEMDPQSMETLLESWRIHACRPRVGAEINDSVLPLEVGLTDAIAQGKGCYPGQEVIERIISMGAPPRRLGRMEGSSDPLHRPSVGDPVIVADGGEAGKITSITFDGNRFTALGLLRKAHAKEGSKVQLQLSRSAGTIEAQIVQLATYAN
jgi:folate-binding protein YgfZ